MYILGKLRYTFSYRQKNFVDKGNSTSKVTNRTFTCLMIDEDPFNAIQSWKITSLLRMITDSNKVEAPE